MSTISFNEEPVATPSVTTRREPLFVRLLMQWGIVKTPQAAQLLLIGTIVLCLVVAVWAFPKGRPAPSENIPVAGPNSTQAR